MTEIDKDFLKLRSSLKEKVIKYIPINTNAPPIFTIHHPHLQGFFKPSVPFFIAHFLHIYFFFFATWGVLWYFGNTWATWLIAAVFMTTCQAQSGWLQHDFGHLSVFNSSKLNHAVHDITIGLMKVCTLHEWQVYVAWMTSIRCMNDKYTLALLLLYIVCRVCPVGGGITGTFNTMPNPMW